MVALAVPAAAAKIEAAFSGAPARITLGAVAQAEAAAGTIVTYNGLPIGYVAPVPAPTPDPVDPTEPVDPIEPVEPELVFFPDSLANVVQVKAGAPGTDASRIPEEAQEELKEKIAESIVAREIAAFTAANNGIAPTAEKQAEIEATVNVNNIDLQESLEIDPVVTLETINNAVENDLPIQSIGQAVYN